MNVSVLPYDLKKVSARLVKAEKEYANYINNICEFEDIEYTHDLVIRMGGESLDFGRIEDTNIYFRAGKEYWEITTMKSYFKFEILRKTQWEEIPIENNEEVVDELDSKRFLKAFHKALDTLLNEESDFSFRTSPWKK